MPALTQTDINVLQSYSQNGQRERYWGYLAALGDKYAVRALEVVQNTSVFGQLANNHAAAFVPDALKATFTESTWNDFGKELMRADFAAREILFNRNRIQGQVLQSTKIPPHHPAKPPNNHCTRTARLTVE